MYINKWFLAQKEKTLKDQKKKDKKSTSVIRRKVTSFTSKCITYPNFFIFVQIAVSPFLRRLETISS